MNRDQLFEQIQKRKSYLCVGLDPDIQKMPQHLLKDEDPLFSFCRSIVDATHSYCVAYKPNTAFFEAHGVKGWAALHKTIEYIRKQYPDHFTIADAKRGDIGNTSAMYARAFFEEMDFHAVTVAPYMGSDSVQPFLQFKDKWVIVLALTSNQGAQDFQLQRIIQEDQERSLYEEVLLRSASWGTPDQLMYVTGATQSKYLQHIRQLMPQHFFLVPGVGAQGGDLGEVSRTAMNDHCGLLVNSSREIIYASNGTDFAERAAERAFQVQTDMATHLIHLP